MKFQSLKELCGALCVSEGVAKSLALRDFWKVRHGDPARFMICARKEEDRTYSSICIPLSAIWGVGSQCMYMANAEILDGDWVENWQPHNVCEHGSEELQAVRAQ